MEEPREFVYLDTYGDGGYSYEVYVDECNDLEIEPKPENSDAYYDWLQEMIDNDIECFFENLKYANGVVQNPCIITGRLGLWWGHPEVEPVECADLASAVRKCFVGCDYIKVYGNGDGSVKVEASHHDGTNYLEINPVDGKYPKYLY